MPAAQEHLDLGLHARRDGKSIEARQHMLSAVSASQRGNDARLKARSLAGLGQIERDLGNTSAAIAAYAQAIVSARDSTDSPLLAHIARHLGDIYLDRNEPQQAEPHLRETLAIYRADPGTAPIELANTLRSISRLETFLAHTAAARAALEEARELYASLPLEAGVEDCNDRLALLSLPSIHTPGATPHHD